MLCKTDRRMSNVSILSSNRIDALDNEPEVAN